MHVRDVKVRQEVRGQQEGKERKKRRVRAGKRGIAKR